MSDSRVFLYHNEDLIGRKSFRACEIVVPEIGEVIADTESDYVVLKIEHKLRRSSITGEAIAIDTLVFLGKLRTG